MIIIESLNYVSLTVSSLENSIEFYKELFDFEVLHKYSDAGKALIRMGDIHIELIEVEGYRSAENSAHAISFYVDEEDFDDALTEVEDSEIEIVYGPENIRNGQTVIFLDPDANRIELSYPKIS